MKDQKRNVDAIQFFYNTTVFCYDFGTQFLRYTVLKIVNICEKKTLNLIFIRVKIIGICRFLIFQNILNILG